MNQVSGYQAYQASRIDHGSPERLVVLAYERIVTLIAAAEKAAGVADFYRQNQSLQKAQAIVSTLQAGLDEEAYPELSSSLSRLYEWFYLELGRANLTGDRVIMQRLKQQIAGLGDAWRQAEAEVRRQASEEQAQVA